MFKRRSPKKYLFISILTIVIYNEFLAYYLQPMFWNDNDCPVNDTACVKVLFIADPQIQGEKAVPAPIKYLFNWDSDRYLRYTFINAFNAFSPDVLVFLGDVTDEGSTSSTEEFHGYIKRLMHIFETYKTVMHIWLPGDNDIGGENEPIRQQKIKEFFEAFNQPDVMDMKNLTFYKVNTITHTLPKMPTGFVKSNKSINVVLSHHPMLRSSFSAQVIEKLQPNILFTAHDHTAQINTYDVYSATRGYKAREMKTNEGVVEVELNRNNLVEIVVPTCSYRMGVYEMGYGAAVFLPNQNLLHYEVLWSPSRFPKIIFYLLLLVVLILYLSLLCIYKIGTASLQTHRYNAL